MKLCRVYCMSRLGLRVLVGFLLAESAVSAEWDGKIVISPRIFYTDNACLTKDNKKSNTYGFLTVAPYGSVTAETSKTTFFASGVVTANTLTNSDLKSNGCTDQDLGDRKQWYPTVFSNLKTVLVDNWIDFSASLKVDQNNVSSFRADSNDGLDRTGNTNTYYRYLLAPHMSRRLAGGSTYDLRYIFSQQLNSNDSVSDSTSNSFIGQLNSDRSERLTGGITGKYARISYSDDVINTITGETIPREDTELRSVALKLAYQFQRRWQANGAIGWEWNDFQTFDDSDTGGSAWDVGVRWTPSPRTTMNAGIGERFFGTTPRFSITHEANRNIFSAYYNKQITFQRDLSTGTLIAPGGISFAAGGAENLYVDGDATFLQTQELGGNTVDGLGANQSLTSNSVIIDERALLKYSYAGRRAAVRAFGSYSQQTREEDGAEADFIDWRVSLTPKLSRKFSVSGSIGYQEIKPNGFIDGSGRGDFIESENWIYTLSYGRPLGRGLNFNFNYRFTDRRSDNSNDEYKENLFVLTLNYTI